MEPVLAQNSSSSGWALLIKVGIPLLFFVVLPLLRKLKEKAAEKAAERKVRSIQSAAEMEAIRTGRGLEQVLMADPSAGVSVLAEPTAPPESDESPKLRRERQLAELRRRAAARSEQIGVQVAPMGGSTSRQPPMPTPSQPMPQLIRQPAATPPTQIILPGGRSIAVGQSGSPPPRPTARPQAKPVRSQQVGQTSQRSQKMTNEQAARAARERQAVPTRVQNTYVSDQAGSSDTHRLVADTEAAKVTARAERKGPKLGRAGLRQAMVMSEIFGKPRSERLDEI